MLYFSYPARIMIFTHLIWDVEILKSSLFLVIILVFGVIITIFMWF